MEAVSTRAEHLAWCKQRANELINASRVDEAFASMGSDLNKHDETRGHVGMELGMMLYIGGHLSTPHKMREFINGFN